MPGWALANTIGRFDDAIAEAHNAMELQPDFPVALFVLGLAYADKGQYQEAIAAHEKALAKYPNGESALPAPPSGRCTPIRAFKHFCGA